MFQATKRALLYLSLIFSSSLSTYLSAHEISASPIVWESEESLEFAFDQAQAQGVPLFIFFTGEPWCPPCVRYAKNYLEVQDVMEPLVDHFVFLKLTYPPRSHRAHMSDRLKALKANYQVEVFPTTIVVDSETKQELYRFRGGPRCSPQDFAEFLLEKTTR